MSENTKSSLRIKKALEMIAFGFAMKKQQLRRQNPNLEQHEIDKLYIQWMRDKPIPYEIGEPVDPSKYGL